MVHELLDLDLFDPEDAAEVNRLAEEFEAAEEEVANRAQELQVASKSAATAADRCQRATQKIADERDEARKTGRIPRIFELSGEFPLPPKDKE